MGYFGECNLVSKLTAIEGWKMEIPLYGEGHLILFFKFLKDFENLTLV